MVRLIIAIAFFGSAISGPAAGRDKAPSKFVTQILEPTGGKIQRPKDWFYRAEENESGYTWTIAREDSAKGPYVTGVRIQVFFGVQKVTGKTGQQFVLDYIAKKRNQAARVFSSCGGEKQGLFTRVCLETEEGPFHIKYSLFWGNDVDWVVAATLGTSKELWDTYSPTFDRMGKFELIDLKRFNDDSHVASDAHPAVDAKADPAAVKRFDEIHARAQQMGETVEGKAYEKCFSTEPVATQTNAALRECTKDAKPPYTINLVLEINADGVPTQILSAPGQPISACVVSRLGDLKLPAPPKPDWLVALNIHVKKPK